MGTVNRKGSSSREERATRAFHASWARPIDKLECTPAAFRELRRKLLNLSQQDAARLLRVGKTSIKNWETGKYPLSFPCYLALLLISESQRYRTPDQPAWHGWRFLDRYDPRTGKTECVMTNSVGLSFTLEELEDFALSVQKVDWLKSAIAALEARVNELTSENTELRAQFRDNGVTAELHEMQDRLDALLANLPRMRGAA